MKTITKTRKPGRTVFLEEQEDSGQEEDRVVTGREGSEISNAHTKDRLRSLLKMLKAVKSGDFSVRLPREKDGVMGDIFEVFNDVVSLNERLANEIVRTSRVIGEEGKRWKMLRTDGS